MKTAYEALQELRSIISNEDTTSFKTISPGMMKQRIIFLLDQYKKTIFAERDNENLNHK